MAEHALRRKPKILLSNFNPDERKVISEQIRNLGGVIYESSNFTSFATHIVCKYPSRGEKFICGCVAGKWVLSHNYISESCKQKQWLDEETFEWTSDKCQEDSAMKELFSLPRKCRKHRESQKFIFRNWVVLLVFVSQKKKEGYKRLIEAGGGKVVNWKAPYRGTDMKSIKYVIYEEERSRELLTFKRAGVPLVNCETIIDHIIKGTALNTMQHDASLLPKQVKAPSQQIKTPSSDFNKSMPPISHRLGFKCITNSFSKSVTTSREKKAKKQTNLRNFFVGVKDIIEQNKSMSVCSPRHEVKSHAANEVSKNSKKSDAGLIEEIPARKEQFGDSPKLESVNNSSNSRAKSLVKDCGLIKEKFSARKVLFENEDSPKVEMVKNSVNRNEKALMKDAVVIKKRFSARNVLFEDDLSRQDDIKINNRQDLAETSSNALRMTRLPSISSESQEKSTLVSSPKNTCGLKRYEKPGSKRGDCAIQRIRKSQKTHRSDNMTKSASPQGAVIEVIDLEENMNAEVLVDEGRISKPDGVIKIESEHNCNENIGTPVVIKSGKKNHVDLRLTATSPSRDSTISAVSQLGSIQSSFCNLPEPEAHESMTHPCNKAKIYSQKRTDGKQDEPCIDRDTRKKRRSKHVEIDVSLLMDNAGPKTRASRTKRKGNDANATESPSKKQKLAEEFGALNQSATSTHYCLIDSLTLAEESVKRIPLHRNGMDLIDGCLEEGHFQTAVKMMSCYLSPKFYLPSKLIYILMELLRDTNGKLDLTLAHSIPSLLHRCILLHPPQFLPNVYLSALRTPLEKNGEIQATGCAFEYLMNLFRELKSLLTEKNDAKNLRKQALSNLVSFVVAVLETDFTFHWKKLERFRLDGDKMADIKRPIFAQIMWSKMEATGSGSMSRELITFGLQLVHESQKNPELVPLRSKVFRLLRVAADCCQISDVATVSVRYGPASRLLTTELHDIATNLVNVSGSNQRQTSCLFSFLRPHWLAARVADLMIGTYDASKVKDAARKLLSKPLSLEKIVSCYFHFIPRKTNVSEGRTTKKRNSTKPLAVIGDFSTELSRLNTCQLKKEKTITVKRNVRGETQLHIACIKNKPSDVKTLLMNGFDPNLKDNAGWTALHEASNHGHTSCVAELLKSKDLDLFAIGLNGFSALHDAVANNRFAEAKLLIKAGGEALLDMKTEEDLTAYELAKTDPMKELLINMRNKDADDTNKDTNVCNFIPAREIEEYLKLLTVLLRSFHSQTGEKDFESAEKATNLKNHVTLLSSNQASKTRMLLNIVKNILR